MEVAQEAKNAVSPARAAQYKAKGDSNQKKRREEFLKQQKEKRRDLTNHARALATTAVSIPLNVEESISMEDVKEAQTPEREMEVEHKSDVMETDSTTVKTRKKVRNEAIKDQLMIPEPLQEIPVDFETGWYFSPCPTGVRCVVIAAKGKTIAWQEDGTILKNFFSLLPSGSRRFVQ